MKLLIATSAILVLFFISSAEAECSAESWNVVKNMAAIDILGRWYCVLRFPNGKNDTSDCLWHDVRMHPTIPNTVQEFAKRTFKNGKDRRRHQAEGVIAHTDPKTSNGLVHVVYKKGSDLRRYITSADLNDYCIVRSCFEGEEYFWAYARNQVPSNLTMTKIYKDIDDQGIDRSKIIKSCTHVLASDLV